MNGADALGVLRGERRDDGSAIDAERRKGLEIRLNAGAAGGIRTCNGERNRRSHGLARWLFIHSARPGSPYLSRLRGRAIAFDAGASSPPPERGRSASAASREGVSLLQLLRLTALHIIEMTPTPTLPLSGGGSHASNICNRPVRKREGEPTSAAASDSTSSRFSATVGYRQARLLSAPNLAYLNRSAFRRRQRWFLFSSRSNASSASLMRWRTRLRKPKSPPRSIRPRATTIFWPNSTSTRTPISATSSTRRCR